MHVLTKIFIVLVALLTVLLVPLVVVYAHNEDNYKAKYQSIESQLLAQQNKSQTEQSLFAAERTRLEAMRQDAERDARDLRADRDRLEAEIRQLEGRLTTAESLKQEIFGKLATLASTLEAGQQLTTTLVDEVRDLRVDAMESETRRVELDEALREKISQLEVAIAARRMLEEELTRMREANAEALDTVRTYVATFGAIDGNDVAMGTIASPVTLQASVLKVSRSADRVLVEIDAGSRDGVREGISMVVADGGTFVGDLRIIKVDINRSTGVLTLEDPSKASVQIGHTATATKGR